MLMKANCPVFQFKDCQFEVQKDREGAARVSLYIMVDCFVEVTQHY